MEQKQNRPYIVYLVEIEGHIWAIPFRYHIRHAYAFFTDPENRCGIDYSKAVVVDRPEYIDQQARPHLRQNEFEALRGNEFAVQKGFEKYIKLYKRAVRSGHPRYRSLIQVEHVADAGPAGPARELPRDRALGGAGAGRHEGPAPPEPGEVGAQVLRGHAPERPHEGPEERMDGVDPVDGSLGAVLGVVGRVRGDPELREDADVGGRPVGRDDGAGRDAAPQHVHGALPRQGAPPRDLEKRVVRVSHVGHDADPLEREAAPACLPAAAPGGARHRERPLRVVALERLREVGLVELAAVAPPDPERGGVGREALDEPVAHGVGGLEADAAAPRAFPQGQHEHEALGVGHPGLPRQPARPKDAPAAHAEGPAAAPAEVALLAVLRFALLHDRGGPAARAALDLVGGAGRVVELRRADHVPDGLDREAALGPAQLRHVPFEGDYQVLGVHAAPIVAVYGANDMAPWGHMYVNPGLTEP